MADDLRSSLEAAVAEVETAASTQTAATTAPATETPTTTTAPVDKTAETGEVVVEDNDSTGKTDGSTPATEPKNGENTVEKSTEKPTGVDRAPQSWKPSAKAKWEAMDPEVRQEVQRREREIQRSLSESSQARRFSEGFKKTVEPYMARFRAANVPPERAITSLLHVDQTLSSAPPEQRAITMAKLIMDYGIDVGLLDNALSGQTPQVDPVTSRLEQMLEQRLAPVQQFLQQTQEQKQRAIQEDFERQKTTVETMASDPKYPLFDLVRNDMADLIEIYANRGVDVSLPDAYNRAVQMNPEAASQAQEMAKRTQAQKAHGDAQRSLGASLSVSGSPSALKTGTNPSDLRGTIEAAMLQATGR